MDQAGRIRQGGSGEVGQTGRVKQSQGGDDVGLTRLCRSSGKGQAKPVELSKSGRASQAERFDGEKYDNVMTDFLTFHGKRSDDKSSDVVISIPKNPRKTLPMIMASPIHLH